MGIVKFFSPSGGTPPPPEYLNYIGMLSGSFANQVGLSGASGTIYIPINNFSFEGDPYDTQENTIWLNLADSGQDVDFYIYGVAICLGNIGGVGGDGNQYEFSISVYSDGVLIENQSFGHIDFGLCLIELRPPQIVTDKLVITLDTSCNSFDIISSNLLFYCTGNIVPPPACEYFEKVAAGNGGSVLLCTSTIVANFKATPLTYQAVNWKGGTVGNRVPRIRNFNTLSSDATATPIQGETYYVEATLSQPYGTNNRIYLFFGYDINDRGATNVPYIDGNLTTPQGFYLVWNPNSVVDPLFMFIGQTLGVGYNGILTFKVGTINCPA
jgi:hypothetical protein